MSKKQKYLHILGHPAAHHTRRFWCGGRSHTRHVRYQDFIYCLEAEAFPVDNYRNTEEWMAWMGISGGMANHMNKEGRPLCPGCLEKTDLLFALHALEDCP